MFDPQLFVPYCGTPPTVATLATRWNLDPRLLAAFAAVAVGYALVTRHGGTVGSSAWRRAASAAGWGVTALALVSPLCALSVSLFCARVGQHMVLTLVGAPLVALSLPARRSVGGWHEPVAATAFALALWFWHAPGPYTATFQSDATYWAMHLTTYGSALAFWWTVLRAPPGRLAAGVAATVATGLQMALLGAVITWAPRALYPPHLLTTFAWGLTPLQDQQLGGAVMWVPAGLIFMAAVTAPLAWAMQARPARHAASSA